MSEDDLEYTTTLHVVKKPDNTNLYILETSEKKSVMTNPCNLCHKPLIVLQADFDREWGWCHRLCINGISTKGS